MLNKHIRIAALQCNFQTAEETLAMPDRFAEIGFNVEQILHTHADLYSAIYDPKRHRDILLKYLENCRKNGIRAIIYMNVHILGPSLKEHFDDWCTRDANGQPYMLYKTYPGSCLNSGWRKYMLDCIESLGEFDIEGVFFDGPSIMTCHCPNCQALFKKMTGKAMDEATSAELEAFTKQNVMEFKHELYMKVKSINPNWIAYYNEGLFSGRMDAEEMASSLGNNDIIGTEGGFFFYDEPRTVPYWKCSSAAKLAEAVAGGRPTVVFCAGDHKAWGWFMHTDSELQLCYASAIGNGASVWMGLHHRPDSLDRKSGEAMREIVQLDKKCDALLQNTKSLAEVAVFYSYNTAAHYAKSAETTDLYGAAGRQGAMPGNYTDAMNGAFAALEHNSIPFDIVTEINRGDLQKYKAVFAPGLAMLDDETLAALKAYVENGGFLCADGEFGFYDKDGNVRKDVAAVRELTGAVPADNWTDMQVFNYMGVVDNGFYNDNAFGYIPAPKWTYKLQLLEGAMPAFLMPEPMPGCYAASPGVPDIPIAASKKSGKGECLYFAGGLFEFYGKYQIHVIRNWFKYRLDKLNLSYRLIGAKPGISISVRQTVDEQVMLCITNFIGVTRPLDGVVSLEGMKLVAPKKTAVDLKTGESLKRDENGDFILPTQTEYAFFLLK